MTDQGTALPDRRHLPFFDVEVTPISKGTLVAWLLQEPIGRRLLLNHNAHSAYFHISDPTFRALYSQADVVLVDGFPLLLEAKFRRSAQGLHRMGSTDWFTELLPQAEKIGLRIGYVGAAPDTLRGAKAWLEDYVPTLEWRAWHGYRDSWDAVIEEINEFRPQLLMVGMGMPRQEKWIVEHLESLPTRITVANVGACIDYYGGSQRLAPRVLGNYGLEWVYRLAHDPRRLAHRYLVEPLSFIALRWRK